MKKLLIIIFFLIFYGCSTKKQYLLLDENSSFESMQTFSHSIGIKDIELPQYLLHRNIPLLVDNNEIVYLKDKEWATYLDEQLTNRIVLTLQKVFNSSKIYRYPQNSIYKPDIIVQIIVHKFIANKKYIMFDISWQLNKNGKVYSDRLHIKSPINNIDNLVNEMNRVFNIFEEKLILSLKEIE